MYQYQFNSMSTMVQISINQELYANDVMPIYKEFDLVEKMCSRFRTDSELSILNKHVGKEISVSSEMFLILTEADQFYKDTEGIFNPGILTSLENSGYAQSIEFIRDREIERTAHSITAVAAQSQPFTLNGMQQSVILHSKIDLGGMAKGRVIDRAASLLTKMGYGFINVGGDIRIFGTLPRELRVGIENPFELSNVISSIEIKNGAVATSTTKKRKWLVNGDWHHHLIDTRSGMPSDSGIVSATVTAPTALEADVWAKTALLLGEKDGREWVGKKGIRAVFINKDGEIWRGGE